MKINLNHLNGPQKNAQGKKQTESLQLDDLALNQQSEHLPEEQGLEPEVDRRRLARGGQGGEEGPVAGLALAATAEAKVEG